MNYKVAILIGSETDKPIIEASLPYYRYFNIDADIHVMSAHRNPDQVSEFSKNARSNGISIFAETHKLVYILKSKEDVLRETNIELEDLVSHEYKEEQII